MFSGNLSNNSIIKHNWLIFLLEVLRPARRSQRSICLNSNTCSSVRVSWIHMLLCMEEEDEMSYSGRRIRGGRGSEEEEKVRRRRKYVREGNGGELMEGEE